MTDAKARSRNGIAMSKAKPTDASASEGPDAVLQLAGALRAAERAHSAYLAELSLGDAEPAEDWSIWYAEYLVGLR
jgi:hypothetical protein